MENDVYIVSDFSQVVYLLCSDMPLLGARRSNPNRVEFAFDRKSECESLIEEMFFSDEVSLSRALFEIRKARNIIHQTP